MENSTDKTKQIEIGERSSLSKKENLVSRESANSFYPTEEQLSPEMAVALEEAMSCLTWANHITFLDKSGNRTTSFLDKFIDNVQFKIRNVSFLCIDMAEINSTNEFVKILASFEPWALSFDTLEMRKKVKKHLSDCNYKLSSCYDGSGIGHEIIDVSEEDNTKNVLNGLEKMVAESAAKDERALFVLLDHVERIEELGDRKEMLSFIHSHLLSPENEGTAYRVVTASSSEKVNHQLTSRLEPGSYQTIDLSSLDKESVKEIVGPYLKRGPVDDVAGMAPEKVAEKLLNYIGELCNWDLGASLELAVMTFHLAEDIPYTDTVDDAFKYLLERRRSHYPQLTSRLSKDAQRLLRLMATGVSFSDLELFGKNKHGSKKMFQSIKEELIQLGVLVERDSCVYFADPYYKLWIKNDRYPVVCYKKKHGKDFGHRQFFIAYPTR